MHRWPALHLSLNFFYMNLYKVSFTDNTATTAVQIYMPRFNESTVNVETINGKRKVNWLTIFADNEMEGICVANKAVKETLELLYK